MLDNHAVSIKSRCRSNLRLSYGKATDLHCRLPRIFNSQIPTAQVPVMELRTTRFKKSTQVLGQPCESSLQCDLVLAENKNENRAIEVNCCHMKTATKVLKKHAPGALTPILNIVISHHLADKTRHLIVENTTVDYVVVAADSSIALRFPVVMEPVFYAALFHPHFNILNKKNT
ncbi:hypothetical protein B9Z55_023427 [Caenorhabditis nigoni]|uniref:Uncharacterized protein n=1 Tax=Caenorhabditis nigoni TaxID=1611254 RepID=A0A2G5SQ48_9PELO|nr:hypothetical protein B9Z55_023427 [Caenorhabditis nigoni]